MTRLTIALPARFRLATVLLGHGFIDLAPHRHVWGRGEFETVLPAGAEPVDVRIVQAGRSLRLEVRSRRPLSRDERDEVKRATKRMLRLTEDLAPFWQLCSREPRLAWVAQRRAGRLLRAPTVFEDLTKLLFTTNCSWAATRLMTSRLVDGLGNAAPSGARSFPSAERCAGAGAKFFREVVRAGYRAEAVAKLARGFADGRLRAIDFEDPNLPTDELRSRLLELPGFGPYAAGQALRLLGHYSDLALDSWCRARLAELGGRRRPPSDRSVERAYARFGEWRGLALWMDLTADWHRDAKAARPLALAVRGGG